MKFNLTPHRLASEIQKKIQKVLDESPYTFSKNKTKALTLTLAHLCIRAKDNGESWFHSTDIQNICHNYYVTSSHLTYWLQYLADMEVIDFVSYFVQHKQCYRWNVDNLLKDETILTELENYHFDYATYAADYPEEFQLLYKKQLKLKSNKYGKEVHGGSFKIDLTFALRYLKKRPLRDLQKGIDYVCKFGTHIGNNVYDLEILYYQYITDGRLYQFQGGVQCLRDWVRKILLTNKQGKVTAANIDIKNCHPMIAQEIARELDILTPELEKALNSKHESISNWKTIRIATINSAHFDRLKKKKKVSKVDKEVEKLTQEELDEITPDILAIQNFLKNYRRITKRKNIWIDLNRREQAIISQATKILKQAGFDCMNMHDGLIIDCLERFKSSGIFEKIQEIARKFNLDMIFKDFKDSTA